MLKTQLRTSFRLLICRGDLGCLGFRTFDSSLTSKGGVVVQWLVLVTRYQDVQV